MYRGTITRTFLLTAFYPVLVLSALWNSGNNYTLLCDATKEYKCDCPSAEGESVLDCSEKGIGKLPEGISFPSKIKSAIFKNNGLKIITEKFFVSGSGLKILELSFNGIVLITSEAFASLENLERLDLSHNEIWSLSIRNFVGLNNLKYLDLSYNKIQSFFREVMEQMPKLEEIILRYNPMLFIERDSFKMAKSLQRLNLENTGLADLPAEVFEENPDLYQLLIGSNNFKEVPTTALKSAKGLKQLDISENPIPIFWNGSFRGLNQLEELMIAHMRKLGRIEAGAFTELPSLREIQLSDNLELAYVSEKAFYDSKTYLMDEALFEKRSLLKVVIRHNALRSIPQDLLRWDEILEIDLSENPWRCDCHMAWVAKYPLTIKTKKTIVCTSPAHLSGKPVAGMSDNDFTCRLLSAEAVIGLSLLVSLSFLVALGGSAFMLYRRSFCRCLLRRSREHHRYMRVVTKKDKVDLEWDHGAEPVLNSSDA